MVNGKPGLLSIWDSSGTETAHVRQLLYSQTKVIIILYSPDDRTSFENVKNQWYPEIKQFASTVPYILVSAQTSEAKRQKIGIPVTTEEGINLTSMIKSRGFIECGDLSNEMNFIKLVQLFEICAQLAVDGKVIRPEKIPSFLSQDTLNLTGAIYLYLVEESFDYDKFAESPHDGVDWNTIAFLAIERDHLQVLQQMNSFGQLDIKAKSPWGNTLLITATALGRFHIARWLVRYGASTVINDQNLHKNTALYYSVLRNDFSTVFNLLVNGADVTIKNQDRIVVSEIASSEILPILTDPTAMLNHAEKCLDIPEGVEDGVKYLVKLLSSGMTSPQCFFLWGRLHDEALGGVPADPVVAQKYYRKARDSGHPEAAARLAAIQPRVKEKQFDTLLQNTRELQQTRAKDFSERATKLRRDLEALLSPPNFYQDRQGSVLLDIFQSALSLQEISQSQRGLIQEFDVYSIKPPGQLLVGSAKYRKKLSSKDKLFQRIHRFCQQIDKAQKDLVPGKFYASAFRSLVGLAQGYRDYIDLMCSAPDEASQMLFYFTPVLISAVDMFGRVMLPQHGLALCPALGNNRSEDQIHGTATVFVIGAVGARIHFKHNPHAPGIEFLVSSLGNLIAGQGATPTELVKIFGPDGIPRTYQASQTVVGDVLERIIRDHPEYIHLITDYNYTATMILGVLTDPQDGKPDNYMVEFTVDENKQPKSLEILGIDNDIAFSDVLISKFVQTPSGKQHQYFINIKNVIYLFPQMNKPVNRTFCDRFLKEHPAVKILNWLKGIADKNQGYDKLRNQGVFTESDFSGGRCSKRGLQLPIRLTPGTIKTLYRKLMYLFDVFQRGAEITHEQILLALEPEVAKHYQDVRNRYGTDIMAGIIALYEENIKDPNELKSFRASTMKTKIMTSLVLRTAEEFGFEDHRTQKLDGMLRELLEEFDYSSFGSLSNAIFPLLHSLAKQIHRSSIFNIGVIQQNIPLVRWLLALRVVGVPQINTVNSSQSTPLHIAASLGNLELVQLLVQNNADPTHRSKMNSTALDLAQAQGHQHVVNWLATQYDVEACNAMFRLSLATPPVDATPTESPAIQIQEYPTMSTPPTKKKSLFPVGRPRARTSTKPAL
jgi:ankyrin repeat protein